MPRHRKRPSEFRSLVPVLYTAPALAVLWAATSILEVVCKPGISCPALPDELVYGLMAVFAAGMLTTLYCAYRDFVKGDYWLDLAEAGYV